MLISEKTPWSIRFVYVKTKEAYPWGWQLQITPVKKIDAIVVKYAKNCGTGCPRMFYTQKCKILRIFITIKTIELGILVYLGDRTVLLAFWRILNEGNRPNKTENTWHYVKGVIFCILIEVGKEGFMSYSA